MKINDNGFICCPQCGNKTRTKVIPDKTKLVQFPLWCPWCKRESIIEYK